MGATSRHKWSREQIELLFSLATAGRTHREIATATGFTIYQVKDKLKSLREKGVAVPYAQPARGRRKCYGEG